MHRPEQKPRGRQGASISPRHLRFSKIPVCVRLETQLASVERGGGAGSRATMIRGAEDAVNRQQAEVDRVAAQQRRNGCQSVGIFSIFTPQPPQCQALNSQADQARNQLDRLMSDLQRTQSGGGNDMESQRQSLIGQLAQNNCGPQYRAAAAAQPRGILDTIFGGSSGAAQLWRWRGLRLRRFVPDAVRENM